ncbi:MAG: glycosyltransferase [candidate division KSB1 bacterium]|nr:glycosyltransferase [candidate division KSB1 bacterium]
MNIKAKKTLRIRCKIAQSAAKTFKPQIMIIDRNPLELPREMRRVLAFVREVLPTTRIVWVLPDVLGAPENVVAGWQKEDVYKVFRHYCDEIWVFGAKKFFDVAKAYELPQDLEKRLVYTGWLKSMPQNKEPRPIRDLQNNGTDRPTVLVTAGSGVHAGPLLDTYMRFLEQWRDKISFKSVVITGPMMPSAEKRRLMERAASLPNVVFHRFSKHIREYVRHSHLVLNNGGYNSLCEILSAEKKALLAPAAVQANEHLMRASLMQKIGAVDMLSPEQLSPEMLGEYVFSALSRNRNGKATGLVPSVLPFNGLSAIMDRILHLAPRKISKLS